MKLKQLLILLLCIGTTSLWAQNTDPQLTVNGSTNNIAWKKCAEVPDKLEFHFFWPGSYEQYAGGVVSFKYTIDLRLNGNVIETKEYTSGDPEIDCYVGPPCPPIVADFSVDPLSGNYDAHFVVKMRWFGIPISTEENLYSNTITVTTPDAGKYEICRGTEHDNADNGCSDNMKIYQFEPGISLVVFKNQGLIYKVVDLGGGGMNMYAMSFNPAANLPGYNYYIGTQDFNTPITDIAYSADHKLMIGFADGKFLKIHGLGGSGQNMFAVNETSGGFSSVPGYYYYAGHQKFNNAVTDVSYIGGYTLVGTSAGKILKANGSGGTGANLFAITETSSGFTGIPGYPYFSGSAKFQGAVTNMYDYSGITLVTFSNGKILKVNGTGGSGQNFFAVNETASGFTGISGYSYYIGAAKFSGNVTDMMYQSNTLTMGFTNGKMLKVNGLGGSGLNMFAVTETPTGFSGLSGYYYYLGHARYSAGIINLLHVNGYSFATFSNGKLLKVSGVGGTGANMYNATETAYGFSTTSTSYGIYVVGSSYFGTVPTDIKLINGQTVLCFSNQKMFKSKDSGGTGYNCFNVAQVEEGFRPLVDYTHYVTGTQLFPCQTRKAKSVEEQPEEPEMASLINVYPNPATDHLVIALPEEFNTIEEQITVELFNINAQVVYSGTSKNSSKIDISVSGFSPGVYLLKLSANQTTLYTSRIIKQ